MKYALGNLYSPNRFVTAYHGHKAEAVAAWEAFKLLCDYRVPRVPGCDTVIRLAWRIECGNTIEQAAAHEFLYRVNLSMRSPICFGAPILLGA